MPTNKNDDGEAAWPSLSTAEREALVPLDELAVYDDLAVSRALQRGEFAPVVRYLREIVAPLVEGRIAGQSCSAATVLLLADMLEGRESSPWHLKRIWSRSGRPTNLADAVSKNIRIGRWIAAHPQSGEFIGPLRPSDPQPHFKSAVADASGKFKITLGHAYKCFQLYENYRVHNERYEPMPVPNRPPRKAKKPHLRD